jgi:E3 ubiquitin-protein ligase synoviolin
LYPDLTDDELANVVDTTCIICREEMQVQQSIKRLSCQHVFHKNCLRSWFQRQQTCMFIKRRFYFIENIYIIGPICRTTVLRPTTPRTAPSYVPPAGFNPPPSASSAPVNSTNTQISPPNINVGTIPMVLPPFGKFDKKKHFDVIICLFSFSSTTFTTS